jgi:hypothetical protein
MIGSNASGLTPTVTPDPDRPDAVILHLPDITYLDTQVWSADIGLSGAALAALRLSLTEGGDFANAVAVHVVRSLFALKDPKPDGSEHYRSGWDDALEAAMDVAKSAALTALTGGKV